MSDRARLAPKLGDLRFAIAYGFTRSRARFFLLEAIAHLHHLEA